MDSISQYWDQTFRNHCDAELGWFETDLSPTFRLLQSVPGLNSSKIFIAGAGTSQLIENLVNQGAFLYINDISAVALDQLNQRLGAESEFCQFEVADLGQKHKPELPKVQIWIDRAVLHFLTHDDQVHNYFQRLRSQVQAKGHVLLAQFSPIGAKKCNGLEIRQWTLEQYQEHLGADFQLIQSFDHVFINPQGDPRPYIYALYQRN